jgi:hypothetical protein
VLVRPSHAIPLQVLICLAICVAGGCGSKSATTEEMGQFRALGVIYSQYLGKHQGKPPTSKEQLAEFIASEGSGVRKRFNVDDGVDLLISPRDNQSLTLVSVPKPPLNGDCIVAYETQGANGTQIAISAMGGVQVIPAAELPSRL